jgi:hypothetical protein
MKGYISREEWYPVWVIEEEAVLGTVPDEILDDLHRRYQAVIEQFRVVQQELYALVEKRP